MNTCILMAEIIEEPELRFTQDNQTPIAELLVQFPGPRPEDPPATLKVVGWGNLAQEIQTNYHIGDRVVIEGRLNMNTIDRPEGFKEKRAELTAQRLHRLDGASLQSTVTTAPVAKVEATPAPRGNTSAPRSNSTPKAKSPAAKFASPVEPVAEPNLDDIPF